jgi:hypothetical protein
MRKVATKIAEECTSTDGFKTKLTQIKEFNQRAKPQNRQTPVMRKVATKIVEECTSTHGFKAKQTQIQELNQRAKPQNKQTPTRDQKMEMKREKKQRTCQGCKQRGNTFIGHTDDECWYNTQTRNNNTPSCTWCKLHRGNETNRAHAIVNCWEQAHNNAKRAKQQRANARNNIPYR